MSARKWGAPLIVMLLVAFVVSSCGSNDKSNNTSANAASTEEQAEATSEEPSEETSAEPTDESSAEPSETPVDSGSADEDIDMEADDDNGDISLSVSQSLPEGFPKDIPIVDDSKTLAAVTTSDNTTTAYSVSYESDKSYDDVIATYKKFFEDKKYENASEMSTEEALILTGTSGENSVWISVTKNNDGTDGVGVAIIYSVPKK